MDLFNEAGFAVGAGDVGGGGEVDEAGAAVAPVRRRFGLRFETHVDLERERERVKK